MKADLLVGLLTGPTVLWLFVRFSQITRRQKGHILFQLRQGWNELLHCRKDGNNRHVIYRGSIVSLLIHVVLGYGLLSFMPWLAYLCVPSDKEPSRMQIYLLLGLGLVLIGVNCTVLWMLPHPRRFKEYGCRTQRELVSALSVIVLSAAEFIAMALPAVGILMKHLQLPPPSSIATTVAMNVCIALTIFLYIWCAAVSICELVGISWEEHFWGRSTLQLARYGPSRRSKLTEVYITSDIKHVLWFWCAIPASIGAIQSVSILYHEIFGYEDASFTVSIQQERFLVVFFLFAALVMSAGFFTQAQLSFEIDRESTAKKMDRVKSLRKLLIAEVFLTQVLPLGLLMVGPYWTGNTSFHEFNVDWNLWRSSPRT